MSVRAPEESPNAPAAAAAAAAAAPLPLPPGDPCRCRLLSPAGHADQQAMAVRSPAGSRCPRAAHNPAKASPAAAAPLGRQ